MFVIDKREEIDPKIIKKITDKVFCKVACDHLPREIKTCSAYLDFCHDLTSKEAKYESKVQFLIKLFIAEAFLNPERFHIKVDEKHSSKLDQNLRILKEYLSLSEHYKYFEYLSKEIDYTDLEKKQDEHQLDISKLDDNTYENFIEIFMQNLDEIRSNSRFPKIKEMDDLIYQIKNERKSKKLLSVIDPISTIYSLFKRLSFKNIKENQNEKE